MSLWQYSRKTLTAETADQSFDLNVRYVHIWQKDFYYYNNLKLA